jgi:arginyl-tRNA synthetase
MTFTSTILPLIQTAVVNETGVDYPIRLDIPNDPSHGDYALTIAFSLAKQLKQSPQVIATTLATAITTNTPFEATAINGFINIRIPLTHILTYLESSLDTPPHLETSDRILLEYVSANPTGPLHIGHGRWAVIGDCLYRLLTYLGVSVTRECYVNDAGHQVTLFNESVDCVRKGIPIPENGYGGDFIPYLVDHCGPDQAPIDFVQAYQTETLHRMDCHFDGWFSETTLHKNGRILADIRDMFGDYVYEKDGAVWFKTTHFGDDKDRVLQKENGDLTYFAADTLYHIHKINRGYTHLINIWGADHHGYIKRMESVIKATQKPVKFQVILGQLVHLYKNGEPVKMSKRSGDLVALRSVIDEIGSDALRYFMIEKKPELHMDFDLELAKQKTMANPVYYIQYAHARLCRIIERSEGMPGVTRDLNDGDRELALMGCRYHNQLVEAGASFNVHHIPSYLYALAKLCHTFYTNNPIIYDNAVHTERLHIIATTKRILSHGLSLLGISSPQKM